MSNKILVVDDETEIADLIEVYLKNENYTVFKFYTAQEALNCIETTPIDLAILDIMLPDMDGFALCRRIRQKFYFPIIMLTAKGSEEDKLKGYDLGADDYMTKPFGIMELLSRVKALLRRSAGAQTKRLEVGNLVLDDERHIVTVNGENCELTFKEYELLKLLMANCGMVLTREVIMERVWGTDFEGESRTLDMHIKTLRQKLGEEGSMIRTVRNVGYLLEKD